MTIEAEQLKDFLKRIRLGDGDLVARQVTPILQREVQESGLELARAEEAPPSPPEITVEIMLRRILDILFDVREIFAAIRADTSVLSKELRPNLAIRKEIDLTINRPSPEIIDVGKEPLGFSVLVTVGTWKLEVTYRNNRKEEFDQDDLPQASVFSIAFRSLKISNAPQAPGSRVVLSIHQRVVEG